MVLPDINKPLLPEHIRYLSFEGGGGKGAAYLGVLIALLRPEFNVFKKGEDDLTYLSDDIAGIAGTSAGGITAALLGAGVPLEELIAMTLDINPSKDPKIEEYKNKAILEAFMDFDYKENFAIVPNLFEKNGYTARSVTLLNKIIEAGISLVDFSPKLALLWNLLMADFFEKQKSPKPEDIFSIFERILNDDGILPGVVMYRHIQFLINKYNKTNDNPRNQSDYLNYLQTDALKQGNNVSYVPPTPPPGLTFDQAKQKYNKREIILTGTNLSRGQVTYFSASMTPRLSIAAAARISASIPLFFKPITIKESDLIFTGFSKREIDILCGTWADGGLINNHPFHVFDVDNMSNLSLNSGKTSIGKLNPMLLPVALDENDPDLYDQYNVKRKLPIDGIFPQLKSVLNTMVENSTIAQFRNDIEKKRTLYIDSKYDEDNELKTEIFNANPKTIIKVANKAVISTLKYFDMKPNQNPFIVPEEIPVGKRMKHLLKEFRKFLPLIYFLSIFSSCFSPSKAYEIEDNESKEEEPKHYFFRTDSDSYIDYDDAMLIETMEYQKLYTYLKNPYIRIKISNPDIKFYYTQIDSVIHLLKNIGYGTADIEPIFVSYSYLTSRLTLYTEPEETYNYFVQSYLDTVQWLAEADKYMRKNGLRAMSPYPYGPPENLKFETEDEYFEFVEKLKKDSLIFITFCLSRKVNFSYYNYINRPEGTLYAPDTRDWWKNRTKE